MKVVKVALPVQINSLFDYLPGEFSPAKGSRVVVSFRRKNIVGVVIKTNCDSSLPKSKLKNINMCLDEIPLLSDFYLEFISWVSDYYHEPLGQVIAAALPSCLRKIDDISPMTDTCFRLAVNVKSKGLSKKQACLYHFMVNKCCSVSYWWLLTEGFRDKTISSLIQRGILVASDKTEDTIVSKQQILPSKVELNEEQKNAVHRVTNNYNYSTFLLDGVTGSGKTQVYLEIIADVLVSGRQVLVLLPEIGLTPQTLKRFRAKFDVKIVVIHSKLTELERHAAWMLANSGEADLVIGTRSAIFTPMPKLGLIVVDEEHDNSFKQQSGLRYSARDCAIMRAKRSDINIVLGSATPSLESYYNVNQSRYEYLKLSQRAGGATMPKIKIVDLRGRRLQFALAEQSLQAIKKHTQMGNQVLLFLNRRGFCPVIFCHDCGWTAKCTRCDTNYTYHKDKHKLICHLCNSQKSLCKKCPSCDSEKLHEVGIGTEKLALGMQELFPECNVSRIDRDTTGGQNTFDEAMDSAYSGTNQILVGTQMLAKGHHLPKLTLVVVVDSDGALHSSDFRAVERLVQTVVQVSGRAGRESLAGEVIIQTHFPENKFLQCVTGHNYTEFVKLSLHDRSQASLPPYGVLALLSAEALFEKQALEFLTSLKFSIPQLNLAGVSLVGPMLAAQQKKVG
ncbi:MAG: primosomal protein N' [Pseudomonadota bacterium]|nr:primosomal protein N' [Pseudomonadota bacterium]